MLKMLPIIFLDFYRPTLCQNSVHLAYVWVVCVGIPFIIFYIVLKSMVNYTFQYKRDPGRKSMLCRIHYGSQCVTVWHTVTCLGFRPDNNFRFCSHHIWENLLTDQKYCCKKQGLSKTQRCFINHMKFIRTH